MSKKGDSGAAVATLQLLLKSSSPSFGHLKVDGDFGAKTEKAVRAFQKSHGLTADGVVGPKTREALGLKPKPAGGSAKAQSTATGSKIFTIAEAELGVHEESAPGKHNKRILEYHKATSLRAGTDEVAWCSSFVNWVVDKSGGAGTNSALAKSWTSWGKQVDNPEKGDIIVIKKRESNKGAADPKTGSSTGYHVGIFVSSTGDHVKILGGNQSNQVKYSNFSLKSYEVIAYRRDQ